MVSIASQSRKSDDVRPQFDSAHIHNVGPAGSPVGKLQPPQKSRAKSFGRLWVDGE